MEIGRTSSMYSKIERGFKDKTIHRGGKARIVIETPHGKIEGIEELEDSMRTTDSTIERFTEDELNYISILTKEGPVLMLGETARNAVIRIIL